jgi:hypothetical protein
MHSNVCGGRAPALLWKTRDALIRILVAVTVRLENRAQVFREALKSLWVGRSPRVERSQARPVGRPSNPAGCAPLRV